MGEKSSLIPDRKRMNKYYRFMIYAILVVLLNLAGITLFFRVDLTANKRYSLSSASREVVATLSEPLTINVFFTKNLPAPYNGIERYLHDLLEEYAVAGNRYFNYRFYNVSSDEGDISEEARRNQAIARSYGIQPVQIQDIERDEVKFKRAYMGMVLIHGDLIEKIPAITSTDGLEYQITSLIRKMNNKISALLNLKEDISVRLYLSSSLQVVGPYININGLAQVPQKVRKVVERLNLKNYGRLKFIHLDPTMDPSLEQEAEENNILKLKWDDFRDSKGRSIKGGHGYAGITVQLGDRTENIHLIEAIRIPIFGTQYSLTEMNLLEESIEGIIENLIDANKKIGYLADHGTLKLPEPGMTEQFRQRSDTVTNFYRLLSRDYSIKSVNLKEGSIPESIECLIIAGPEEEFSDYELFQIDQFLMKGKSLAIFLDSFKETMPKRHDKMITFTGMEPVYIPLNTGLEKLLKHYGLKIKKSYVLDLSSYRQRVPRQFGGGADQIYFAPIIKDEYINHDLGFLRNIKGLIMLKVSPLSVDEGLIKENSLRADLLFSSSSRSWEMAGNINLNPRLITPPLSDEEMKSYPLAYILEGSFRSYFAERPVPSKPSDDKDSNKKEKRKEMAEGPEGVTGKIKPEGEVIRRGKPARIFLIGTSEVLRDNLVDEDGISPNAMFVLNTIDHLNNRDAYAEMRSKTQQFNPLRDTGAGTKTFVKAFNIAGLPVLVILCGLLMWGRRVSRKRRIEEMFRS
jgi:ABC-type uncharacterized transport system involved in gliding motility auxiliary subunit